MSELHRLGTAVRSRLAPDEGIRDSESYSVTIIPSFDRQLSELSQARRKQFADNLLSVVKEVLDAPEPLEPEPAAPMQEHKRVGSTTAYDMAATQSLFATACAICRGKCCGNGADHAYLSAETIRRFQDRHPGSSAKDVVAAYLEHIPLRTLTNSCVFHGEGGCTLPTDMRAATCNNFYCDELHHLRDLLNDGAPRRAFFVSVDDVSVTAMKFVDATLGLLNRPSIHPAVATPCEKTR